MKEQFEKAFEASEEPFKEGAIITCPLDGTGIKWIITRINSGQTIFAQVVEGQQHSEFYPITIEIVLKQDVNGK